VSLVLFRIEIGNENKWIYASDSYVHEMEWKEVKEQKAYVLFYEKI